MVQCREAANAVEVRQRFCSKTSQLEFWRPRAFLSTAIIKIDSTNTVFPQDCIQLSETIYSNKSIICRLLSHSQSLGTFRKPLEKVRVICPLSNFQQYFQGANCIHMIRMVVHSRPLAYQLVPLYRTLIPSWRTPLLPSESLGPKSNNLASSGARK